MSTVLHICSDYSKQKLYKELILSLAEVGTKQIVLVPVRSSDEIGAYDIVNNPMIKVIYAHILNKTHRLFYFTKIKRVFKFIIENSLIDGVDVIHSHFLFSDGGVAYMLNRKFRIPYITAVRNTDINVFWKYLVYLRNYGRKIAKSSNKLIFLSPAYANDPKWKPYGDKVLIIPNGIKDHWFNVWSREPHNSRALRFLYVGDFTENKNVHLLLQWIVQINKKIECSLTLVGGGGGDEKRILDTLNLDSFKVIKYLGRIKDENDLKAIYNAHDCLVLISRFETFGLVCIEAISQGLPILYTAKQGVDGYFATGDFAFPISFGAYDQFEDAALTIIQDLEKRRQGARDASKMFNWKLIAKKYLEIYEEIM
jgi:glycosyltransferase involved in cell wall biosynthesis